MWTRKTSNEKRLRDYDRHMLRSAFVSVFWGAITEKRKNRKFTLQELANRVGTNKSVVSRWFSKPHPNWRSDTMADIASALDLDLEITARDRLTGAIYTPQGVHGPEPTIVKPISIVPITQTFRDIEPAPLTTTSAAA